MTFIFFFHLEERQHDQNTSLKPFHFHLKYFFLSPKLLYGLPALDDLFCIHTGWSISPQMVIFKTKRET